LYACWPLKVLGGAVVITVVCASIFRIPFRPARLGAHLAHLGVILLAGGAVWYVAGSVSGYAVAHRVPASGQFGRVDRFYLEETGAVYVSRRTGEGEQQTESPLPALPPGEPGSKLSLSVASPPGSPALTVTDYLPSAHLQWQWRDDGLVDTPAVEVVVHDGPHAFRRTLFPEEAFAPASDAGRYSVRFSPQLQADEAVAIARQGQRDIAWIVRAGAGPARLWVFRPDGSRQEHDLQVGQEVSLALAGRPVKLQVLRFFSQPWLAGVAQAVQDDEAPPAVKLEIAFNGWRGSHWVGYYHSVRPVDPGSLELPRLRLPDGSEMYFQFAPQSRPLEPFSVAELRYLTRGGSGIPKDYVSLLAVLDPAGRPVQQLECRLNRPADVGRFRLYHSEWRPDPEHPTEAIFLVTARPGVWAVWLGCLLICVGIPYGFYVKPLLLRRTARRAAT
jgi:hypothetical protein